MLTTILPIPILLSLLLATPLATSAATSKYGGTFEFCNGNNLVGPCVTQSFNYGTCYLVPDSNAKGDAGSSFQVRQTPCPFPFETHVLTPRSLDDIPQRMDRVHVLLGQQLQKGERQVVARLSWGPLLRS